MREGLLPATELLNYTTPLAFAFLEHKYNPPTSVTAPFSSPFSCELDGPIASLLGTGVAFLILGFWKAGVLTGTVGFAITLLFDEVLLVLRIPLDAVLGVPSTGVFLVKKLLIDRCTGPVEPVLEFSFLRDGGGLAGVARELEGLTILAVVRRDTNLSHNSSRTLQNGNAEIRE